MKADWINERMDCGAEGCRRGCPVARPPTPQGRGQGTLDIFGTDVADLVAEVTEDKSLPKEERRKIQAETAHKKPARVKILRLADKTSNLRSLITSPAPDWSVRRKIEYIGWARKTAEGLRGASASLERQFDEAARAAERSLVPPAGGD